MTVPSLPPQGSTTWFPWASGMHTAVTTGVGLSLGGVAATVSASGALVADKHNPVDASGGARTMTLPTGLDQGTELSVEKIDTSANTVTVTGNMRGVASQSIVLSYQYNTLSFRADSSGSWWPLFDRWPRAAFNSAVVETVAAEVVNEAGSPITNNLDLTYVRIDGGAAGLEADDSVKSADTARTNTASMTNDPHLALTLPPNKLTRFHGALLLDSQASSADFKCQWTLPSGATMKWRLHGPGVTITGGSPGSTASAAPAITNWEVLTEASVGKVGGLGVGTLIWVDIEGLVTTGATGGDMRLQWAQNVADATTTTLYTGSRLRRVSISDIVATPDPPPTGSTNVVTLGNGVDFNMNGQRLRVQSPGKSYSFQAIVDPYTPLYSRHELRQGDVWTDGRQRCEARHFTAWPYNTDIWFSCAMRVNGSFPTGSYCDVIQWRQDMEAGESGGKPPPFTMDLSASGTEIRTRTDATKVTTSQPPATSRYSGSAMPLNTWVDWLFKFRFSWTGGATLLGWRNGTQILNLTSINMGYNDDAGPYIKWGQYRAGAPETFIVEVANPEITTTSLASRQTSPLAHPTF